MAWICFNGKYVTAESPVLTAGNRSFKWGDGIFETIRVIEGNIRLRSHHFDRLFSGLKLLQVQFQLDALQLSDQILEVCSKNECTDSARVRLAVWRNDEDSADFLVEAIPISKTIDGWNEKGQVIDVYPFGRKSMDAFSSLKSASYLIYIMAGRYANEKNLDDVIVMNAAGRICDSSRANIFLIRNNEIYTPALTEGCINGVMRRFVIDHLKQQNYRVHQQEINEKDLVNADEVFLTNAIMGIRPVGSFRDKSYPSRQVFSVFSEIFTTIHQ